MRPRATLAIAVVWLAAVGCANANSLSSIESLNARVAALSAETSVATRANALAELAPSARAIALAGDAAAIPEATIEEIASWLANPGEEFGACVLLTEIGPRARLAVPMVDAAIARIEADISPLSIHGRPSAELTRLRQCRQAISG